MITLSSLGIWNIFLNQVLMLCNNGLKLDECNLNKWCLWE